MAKKEDPKFVRLTPRLSRNVISDVQVSGWSISGLDVKPFPDGDSPRAKAAAKYVRTMLRAGNLEPCSRAEYDEVQEQAKVVMSSFETHQEGAFQREVEAATEKLRQSREEAIAAGASGTSGEADDDDDDDDDEEDDEEVQEKKPAPKKSAPKSKK